MEKINILPSMPSHEKVRVLTKLLGRNATFEQAIQEGLLTEKEAYKIIYTRPDLVRKWEMVQQAVSANNNKPLGFWKTLSMASTFSTKGRF